MAWVEITPTLKQDEASGKTIELVINGGEVYECGGSEGSLLGSTRDTKKIAGILRKPEPQHQSNEQWLSDYTKPMAVESDNDFNQMSRELR